MEWSQATAGAWGSAERMSQRRDRMWTVRILRTLDLWHSRTLAPIARVHQQRVRNQGLPAGSGCSQCSATPGPA